MEIVVSVFCAEGYIIGVDKVVRWLSMLMGFIILLLLPLHFPDQVEMLKRERKMFGRAAG